MHYLWKTLYVYYLVVWRSFFILGVKMGVKGTKERVQMAGRDGAENGENTAELKLVITISKEHCSSEFPYSHQPR